MDITYYHRPSLLTTPEQEAVHQRICELLDQLRARGTDSSVEDAEQRFPTYESQLAFLEQVNLRDFAARYKVGLGRIFGSRQYSFSWLPAQFLLVRDRQTLIEVFP